VKRLFEPMSLINENIEKEIKHIHSFGCAFNISSSLKQGKLIRLFVGTIRIKNITIVN
jgi:hypothetical protein